jgi:hypothetical protein
MDATVLQAPASPGEFLRVEVDSQPGRARECPWPPRGDALPAPGDAALVVESDAGELWCVAWWPRELDSAPEPDPGPSAPPIEIVTSLPESPSKGDAVLYRVPSGLWLLVADGDPEATGHPWACAGGPPLYADAQGEVSTASTTPDALAGGPEVSVPVDGLYDLSIGARITNSLSSRDSLMGYQIGADPALEADAVSVRLPSGQLAYHARTVRRALAGETAISARYWTAGEPPGTATFAHRVMTLWPVRVGP